MKWLKNINILLLLCSFLSPVFSQASSQEDDTLLNELNKIALDLSNQSTMQSAQEIQSQMVSILQQMSSEALTIGMMTSSQEFMTLSNTLSPQEISQMSASQLLTTAIETLKNVPTALEEILNTQSTYSNMLSSNLKRMNELLSSLLTCLTNMQKALESNKEDTAVLKDILGQMAEDTDLLKAQLEISKQQAQSLTFLLKETEKRNKANAIFTNIAIPVAAVSGGCIVGGIINKEKGLIIGGAAGLSTTIIVYNFGHFAFKLF